jgi:hypothetical protein
MIAYGDEGDFEVPGTGNIILNGGTVNGYVSALVDITLAGGTVTASQYYGNLSVAGGLTYTDGTKTYTGNISIDDDLSGKTLRPALLLANSTANSSAISSVYNKKNVYAKLNDRTLYKDNEWNTLCLPFNVDDISTTPLAGATIMELDAANSNLIDGALTLTFTDATSIKAGKPYIIKWASGVHIENPVFDGVTISSEAPEAITFGDCSFVGNYDPFSIVAREPSRDNEGNINEIVFLGGSSTLGYAAAERTLGTMRAHFYIPAPSDGSTSVKSYSISFGGDATETGIIEIQNSKFKIQNLKLAFSLQQLSCRLYSSFPINSSDESLVTMEL